VQAGKAEEALQRMREIMGKLKLTVNEEKTRICKVPEGSSTFWDTRLADVFAEDRQSPYRHVAVEEEHPAHGRKGPCADRTENGVGKRPRSWWQVEPHAARLGELLQV
jgi:hypothetical protein